MDGEDVIELVERWARRKDLPPDVRYYFGELGEYLTWYFTR